MPHPSFHPLTRAWFEKAFDAPTEAQTLAFREIFAGKDTLIAAPTGSGKTLAAFLTSIDALVRKGVAKGDESEGIQILYVSPLKALSSDVQKNLEIPLEGIRETARALGQTPPDIRTALRSGDTTQKARAQILKKAPHILVTTPESLYLMLTSERARDLLRSVKTVIVDELHALMRDKRGSHLALSLARLEALADQRPQRIGLSATVHPIELACRFLVGPKRPCSLVDVGHRRKLDLGIEVPSTDLEAIPSNEQWKEIYDSIARNIELHRTTLVFVNTRRVAEKVAHNLSERLGEDKVSAHHGSLSKDKRLQLEQKLKAGQMRAIVATASLELGIDVGTIDLVCQLGSPRSITTFLQRIGRSGHSTGLTSKGRLYATSRDELVECAALIRAIAAGRLDRIEPPVAPLDILAQQIVAECSAKEWSADDLFSLYTSTESFHTLTRERFDEVVEMLSEGTSARVGRISALIHHDRVSGMLRGRRASRLVAITSGGAIPDNADYRVVLDPDETFVGTVNEDWAIESSAGDVFLLGSHSWRIRRVESRRGLIRVTDAQGQPPSVPFWLGEAPGRTWELSGEVSRLRQELIEVKNDGRDPVPWLVKECGLSSLGAEEIATYCNAQHKAMGTLPTMTDVVFERFFDEAGGMQLVVHAPFGARVNRAFGLALRKRFCVNFDFELQAAATDDAIVLSMGTVHSFPLTDAFKFVRQNTLRKTLEQAILLAPMFGLRWRWNATRALALQRFSNGKKVQPFIQRMRSDDLLAAVFPAQVGCQENATGPIQIPRHPLVDQTVDDCLYEAMDIVRLSEILGKMESGEIRLHARDTTEPSPFSHEILNAKPYAFLDDAPLEERRTRAVSLRRTLPEDQKELGALDLSAIERVREEASPTPRDADELHDTLMSLLVWEVPEAYQAFADQLVTAKRAATVMTPRGPRLFAREQLKTVAAVYPKAKITPKLAALPGTKALGRDDGIAYAARGHSEVLGPFLATDIERIIGIEDWEAQVAVARLEGEGAVLRGSFTPSLPSGPLPHGNGTSTEVPEFCDRRLLARIHRMTIDRLRKEVEPVSAQDFMRYLFDRHQLTPGSQSGGRVALRSMIEKLQGFEISARKWERDVLALRVQGYKREWLDDLCLGGEVSWVRLTLPRPEAQAANVSLTRRVKITLAARRDLPMLIQAVRGEVPASPETDPTSPSKDPVDPAAIVLRVLRQKGALFFDDLLRISRRPRFELTAALWSLVSQGLVTSDAFQPLRELMTEGQTQKRGRGTAVRGRWSAVDWDTEEPAGEVESARLKHEELADRVAGQLLARYGVVFRELTERESFTVPFRDVLRALRRREAKGLIRGGRFIAGFVGEQFALPEALDALRAVRREERTGTEVRLRAGDPLNLVGIIIPSEGVLPGPRIPSTHKQWLVFRDGAFLRLDDKRPAELLPAGIHLLPPPRNRDVTHVA